MRALICFVALTASAAVAFQAAADESKDGSGPGKSDPHRVKGMKAAVADIEADMLRLKVPPLPAPAWHETYLALLKKEFGIEAEHVVEFTGPAGRELHGYNAVMTLEIEHRFGKGVLDKMREKAEKPK